ncbi:MAG TPA: DNA-processing protein DprA [Terriglobales bacterium]|jgi:DNA processing protein|nr:DNA-processing protein DprA [Terriglobales bacterium]
MSTNPSPARTDETRALHWMALALTPGLGPTRARHLAEYFGSVDHVFQSSLTSLEAAGIPAAAAQSLATGKSLELADEELVRARVAGASIITLDDPAYPTQLRQIYDPPLALYVRGAPDLLSQSSIAIVGTRHPTPYGLGMAERLSCDLAARHLVIVSGLARGIDAAGHRGALAGRGKTVAIFGTGVDVIYPRENHRLADQILATGGALCSEFPMATFAAPQNFPIRNRIISGLALGVLVIEAGEYSGTRITARCALEQNREMFAVPGNVTNRQAWGPNTLIKQGAKLVATWEDVWEELPAQIRLQLAPLDSESSAPATASLFEEDALSPHERRILSLLRRDESTHIDELVERLESELSSSEIFAALFELELAGKVRQLPGKNFVKAF